MLGTKSFCLPANAVSYQHPALPKYFEAPLVACSSPWLMGSLHMADVPSKLSRRNTCVFVSYGCPLRQVIFLALLCSERYSLDMRVWIRGMRGLEPWLLRLLGFGPFATDATVTPVGGGTALA